MAETSGFFQAMWDDTLKNPITEEYTGWWDRDYVARQFANYFALFIGNGVFGSPTNQLKVIPGPGLSVMVTQGYAFINGMWYHNDSDLVIPLVTNGTPTGRIDAIKVRYSEATRSINCIAATGDTAVTRGENVYDLKLAEVSVLPLAVELTAANITDTRPNESVCGFVKELLEVETTEDLFAQYNALFTEWFDSIKDQLTGDLAVRLQLEFNDINERFTNTTELVENFVYKDYVIPEQELVFVDRECIITDEKVRSVSLIDVYFTADTILEAEECEIYVDSYDGYIKITAEKQPTSEIRAMIRVRVLS